MKVTGCIVTHNNKDTVLDTIESIFKYTKEIDFTLYVSDNQSTGDTLDIIRTKFPQVVVIQNKENRGFGAGHNAVLDKVDSDVHMIINPDIVLHTNVIKQLSDYIVSHNDVAMAVPKVLNVDLTEQHLPKRDPKFIYLLSGRLPGLKKYRRYYTMEETPITKETSVEFASGCFMAVRTSLFKQVGGFDDRYFMYFEDADLSRTLRAHGKVLFLPQYEVIHLWERAGAKSLKFFLIQVKSMFSYFSKWK